MSVYPIRFPRTTSALRQRSIAGLLALVFWAGISVPASVGAQQAESFEQLAAQAAAARDQQNIPLAVELYSCAEKLKPDWTEGWWYLTLLQYSTNQFSGAIDAATHLLQLAPQAVPAMALRGLSEFETGDYESSLRDLEQAVAHGAANDPHNEQIVRYHLALVLTHAGRFQEALDQYALFAKKHLSDPEMLVGLGLAGMRIPALPAGINPQDRDMMQQAGAAGYALLAGDSVEADTLFQQLFTKYPKAPNLHLFYGFLLFSHDPSLAAGQFQAEVAVAPGNDSARALLAYTLMIDGRFREALPEAERAYAAAPDVEITQLALGRSLGETGQLDRGMELLRTVLKKNPNNLEAHIGMAALLARAGRREEAYRERMACLALAK